MAREFARGRHTDHIPHGGGPTGHAAVYVLETGDGRQFACDYTDIVTETFRSLDPGDEVRFVVSGEDSQLAGLPRARYVVRMVDHSDLFYKDLASPE